MVDARVACGVELMSRVPMGATDPEGPDVGKPVNKNYWEHHEFTSQFEGAERIADTAGHHPRRLRRVRQAVAGPRRPAWAEDRFGTQILADRRPRPR